MVDIVGFYVEMWTFHGGTCWSRGWVQRVASQGGRWVDGWQGSLYPSGMVRYPYMVHTYPVHVPGYTMVHPRPNVPGMTHRPVHPSVHAQATLRLMHASDIRYLRT